MRELARKLRLLTYSPRLQAIARVLSVSGLLRDVYFRLAADNDGVLRVNLKGVEVLYSAPSALDCRSIEGGLQGSERDFSDALLSSLCEGDVFLDVGSEFGLFAIPAAKRVGGTGLVVAVEPGSWALKRLDVNIRLNRLLNVRVFSIALGDRRGEAYLSWSDGSCPSLLHELSANRSTNSTSSARPSSGSELISVMTGDQLLQLERLPVPKAVKVDVEGYEYQVLRGLETTLRDRACRLICCEIHPLLLPVGITPEVILGFVRSVGFERVISNPSRSQIHMMGLKDGE